MRTSILVPLVQMFYLNSWRAKRQFCIRPRPTGLPRGSVGVITLFIPDDNKTVAVMFSVPFDRNLFENWWDAKVYPGKKEADYDMWSYMYYNYNPFKGDDGWHEKPISEGYSVKGIMTSAGQCKLQVKIWK